ncbi:hypothetical protein KR009_006184 [Drosophila setifemur]|nr:hypothetical protein KR009_006184 [Drosophila setifemur]
MGMVEATTSELRLEAHNSYTYLLATLSLTLTFIVMLGACLCCKKRIPKNDLMGLEGMVKLKNPDEVVVVTTLVGNSESQAELNASTVSNADSEKRSSTAAHRSLPDIPVAESNDNGSELYETVADKQMVDARKSPQPSLKKQTSVSQHSSISQADDVSSPYSRVKGLPHDYAKVRGTEHPYAQLNAPSTSHAAAHQATSAAAAAAAVVAGGSSTDGLDPMQHSEGSREGHNDSAPAQVEIPAASAIAGMISASQDLPYMTPPIANQHFSGDSQDSSKGYTSISVREPLANILAQQPPGKPSNRNPALSRDVNDSHYATVSDDSDETYAAIEDPNNRHPANAADIYTSGSETYAQIQPMQINPIVVAVEINNSSSLPQVSSSAVVMVGGAGAGGGLHRPTSGSGGADHNMPHPPPVDSLRAQMHSRQASSSSNNSTSVCNLGSPKPEKRQANSPLPPTPKSSGQSHHLHAGSISNLASGRNSVISVIEAGIGDGHEVESGEASPQRKHSKSLSPSKEGAEGNKNIEGMYAKVMKKHKFSRNSPSSQNSSPILTRKQQQDGCLGVIPLDSAAAQLVDAQKGRGRSNSYSAKDHGYETIPAEGQVMMHENRKSDCYAANMLQKERQQEVGAIVQPVTIATAIASSSTKHYETIPSQPLPQSSNSRSNNDPGYEQLHPVPPTVEDEAKKSDYDPNYEVLKSRAHSDDGYAKVLEKKRPPDAAGYSTIPGADANHNYASILETKAAAETDHYARIAENATNLTSPTTSNSNSTTTSNSVSLNSSTVVTSTSQYESLTGTGSETDPNYESVCYLTMEPDPDSGSTQASSPLSGATSTPSEQLLVEDYFHV